MPQHVDVTVTGDWRDYIPRPHVGGWSIDPRNKGIGEPRQPYIQPKVVLDPNTQPPVVGDNLGGNQGTGNDPLSTLAAAYMASLGGSGGVGATAPIVIPAAAGGEGTAVNWPMIGALAAVALVLWAIYTWWKKHHGGTA